MTQLGVRICFTAYEDNEQLEPGDTLAHTFLKPNWPVCQTRYWYYIATIGGLTSRSNSAIYSMHHVAPVPGEDNEIMAVPAPSYVPSSKPPQQVVTAAVTKVQVS